MSLPAPVMAESPRELGALHVDFLTDIDAIERFGSHWEALTRRGADHGAPFFQSLEWCIHVTRERLKADSEGFKPLVAVVRRSDNPVGIWPLALQRTKGVSIARCLDDPFGQFAGVAFETLDQTVPGIHAVLASLRARGDIDGLSITGVVAGSGLHRALRDAGVPATFSNEAPWIDLAPYPTFRDFQASVTSKTRKNLRNAVNRLQRAGRFEFHVTRDRGDLHQLAAETFDGRLEWLNQRGKSSTAFRHQTFRPLVTSLANSSRISLLGFSITLDGHRIASQWGFEYDGSYYAYISARDERYESFSAGRILLGMVIESCHRQGLKRIELMPPAVDYKLSWTSHVRRLEDFVQPFTLKGRLVLGMLDGAMIPAARSLVRRLPMSARQRLSAMMNRP